MTLADRVVVLRDGLIEQVGTPLELYDRPANQFVAQFIGMPSMNMVDTRGAARASRALTGGRLPSRRLPRRAARRRAWCSRPARGRLRRPVELIESLGADTLIHVDVGRRAAGRAPERAHRAAGRATRWASSSIRRVLHLFNREGQAVAA